VRKIPDKILKLKRKKMKRKWIKYKEKAIELGYWTYRNYCYSKEWLERRKKIIKIDSSCSKCNKGQNETKLIVEIPVDSMGKETTENTSIYCRECWCKEMNGDFPQQPKRRYVPPRNGKLIRENTKIILKSFEKILGEKRIKKIKYERDARSIIARIHRIKHKDIAPDDRPVNPLQYETLLKRGFTGDLKKITNKEMVEFWLSIRKKK